MTTLDAYDRLVHALEVGGYGPSGNGTKSARCPAHPDRSPSLSVKRGDRVEGVLVTCHAGCTTAAVMEALGLTVKDLFDEQPPLRDVPAPKIAATYDYVDETGALLFQAVRMDPKDFRQRRPNGNGGWIWKLEDARRVIYRLPKILEAAAEGRSVFIVEGEKDVHALERAGEIATTNPMGAKNWRDEYADYLKGVEGVYLVVDKDAEGLGWARRVAASLTNRGIGYIAYQAAIGKDTADHLGAGKAVKDFVPIELDEAQATDPPQDPTGSADEVGNLKVDVLRARLLTPAQLDSLPAPTPLVADLLMCNTLTAAYGRPGSMKSFLAMDLAMCVATGKWWQGRQVVKGPVLYVAAEGAFGLPMRKQAWEAHHRVTVRENLVWLPTAVNMLDAQWAEALVQLTAELGPVLVVIDTVSRSMPGGDENAPKDMGMFVANADQLRQASSATVLLVHHTPKDGSSLRGHSSLEGALDTAMECKADGPWMTLSCAKQKDSAPFADVRLHLQPVGESAVLSLPNGVSVVDDLGGSESTLLEAMCQSCGSDGLSASALIKVSELNERTVYRALKALLRRGVVINVGTEKKPRYVPTTEVNP